MTEENTLKVFNKTLSHIPLSVCYSFFHENTLVEETSPLLIDRDIQTTESGGFCKEAETQYSNDLLANVFIESVISGTTEHVVEYQNEYTQYTDEDITHTYLACDSFTQTLLTNCASTGENGNTGN